MKKVRLNAVLASILSLTVACSGFAFASSEEASTPELPQEETANARFTRQNDLIFDFDESMDESEAKFPELSSEESKDAECALRRQISNLSTENGRIIDELLQSLEGLYLAENFPSTAKDLVKLSSSQEATEFLDYLKSEITRFSDEHREDIAAVMFKIYLIVNSIYRNIGVVVL